jgi:hypothetical protein
VYCNQGRWDEAVDLELQVMEDRVKVLGVQHPSTLVAMVNLAISLRKQGRGSDAEDLLAKVKLAKTGRYSRDILP